MSALKRLTTEFNQLMLDPNPHYSISLDNKNLFKWNILLFGPSETIFEGGIFKCELVFPSNYPNTPPKFKFIDTFFHPNIYADGQVCISILHEGHDIYEYEHVSERWNPSHSVNSILISLLSILSEPNFESPANVDASKLWRENFIEYKKIIYNMIAKS